MHETSISDILEFGETIVNGKTRINGLPVAIPKKPKKSEIAGSSFPKKKQKWTRTELPEDFESLTAEEQGAFVVQEWDRRKHGHWFMCDGTPKYITGAHYFYLNWCKIDVGYPEYRDRDRRFFLFWDACEKDPDCYGMIFMKHRREGASWKAASLQLYYISGDRNAHGGMLSKTGKDASDLFQKAVYMFRELPEFFQPIMEGSDSPKSVLSFSQPASKITRNNKKVSKTVGLNSKIDWRNTKENSYDSTKLKFFNSDECGKWEEADVLKNWQIVKPCLSEGRRVYGKALFTSTVNDMDSGGSKFKQLWENSNFEEKDGNNRTKSGLYRYFTPCYDGYEGFIDEYGNSVVENPETPVNGIDGYSVKTGSKEFFANQRESLARDTNSLAEHKRQFPFSPDEALRSPAKDCCFNAEKIYQQLEFLDSTNDKLLTKGNFIWRNGKEDGDVVFEPNRDSGRWRISWLPDKEDQNQRSNSRGGTRPGNESWLVSGCDPYDHDTTTDGKRSDAASYVFRKYNPAEPAFSHMFVCEYVSRPPKVTIFYEDMIKQCLFYGCQILVENNKPGIINYFKQRGYGNYLMARPETTMTNFSSRQKIAGIPTTGGTGVVIDSIISSIESYVFDRCGYDDEGGVGNVFFPRLLNDWLKFEPNNRTKYDATMASGIALLATQKRIRQKEERKHSPFLRKFNNSGGVSKRIRL
jgi:hypothetical protein